MREVLRSALLRKQRRDQAREDIQFFAEYYLPHLLENKTPQFHREILSLLTRPENRLGIAAPRGFAKSTLVQIIYGLHCLLFNQGEDILSISQSANLAEDWIRKIKFELEGNQKIKEDFGLLFRWGEKESKRWTVDHIVIHSADGRPFSQMRARGRGCQVRGLRPTKVFADDLEDDELVRSEEQRKIMKEWFLSALLNVLKIDQQLVVIGTVLHPLALLNDIVKKKEQFEEWATRKYIAVQPDGKSIWEDRFPIKGLMARKREIGTYAFEQEYQNNPIASDICLWKPEWIRTYEEPPRKFKVKFVALDPASSEKESGDYSAMVCMGVGDDDRIYEIETWRGHWGTWDLIKNIIAFYKKHKPIRFGIEEVAWQNFIRQVLQREAKKQKLVIPIERIVLGRWTGKERERKSSKDKYTRALSVIHYWEQGLVYLKTQDLVDEISLFPTGSHDDMVDACVWCMKMIMKHAPVAIVVKPDEERKRIPNPTIKNNQMPNPFPNPFKWRIALGRDWRIGG